MEKLICNMMTEPTNFVTDPSLSKHTQVSRYPWGVGLPAALPWELPKWLQWNLYFISVIVTSSSPSPLSSSSRTNEIKQHNSQDKKIK